MKLKFKKSTFSRKGDITYCTTICIVELSNLDIRLDNVLPRRQENKYTDYNKVFKNFIYEDSTEQGLIYKAVSIGKAIKSITDTDNPGLAEKLAEARARLNCYKYAEAICNARFHYLKELAFGNLLVTTNCPECTSNGGMYDQWLRYQYLVEKQQYHIDKLLSEL